MPELLSIFVAFIGFLFSLPVYVSYYGHLGDTLHVLIIGNFLLPVVLALSFHPSTYINAVEEKRTIVPEEI